MMQSIGIPAEHTNKIGIELGILFSDEYGNVTDICPYIYNMNLDDVQDMLEKKILQLVEQNTTLKTIKKGKDLIIVPKINNTTEYLDTAEFNYTRIKLNPYAHTFTPINSQ